MVVPKAALYQNQTFFAKGKGKQIQQLVSNLRGDPLAQGRSQSWEGKMLKIPPVSPSILDCPIIKVEYAVVVSPVGLDAHKQSKADVCVACKIRRFIQRLLDSANISCRR